MKKLSVNVQKTQNQQYDRRISFTHLAGVSSFRG